MKKCPEGFCVQEFVPEEVYLELGDDALEYIDEQLLDFIGNLRVALKASITINNWKWGGRFSQRGLRTKASKYYSKTSQHSTGCALDFDVEGYTAGQVRQWIIDNLHLEWVKYITFIEDGVNWVHVDVGLSHGRKRGKLIVWDVHTKQSVVY